MPAKGRQQALVTTPHDVMCASGLSADPRRHKPVTSIGSILTLPKLHLATLKMSYSCLHCHEFCSNGGSMGNRVGREKENSLMLFNANKTNS